MTRIRLPNLRLRQLTLGDSLSVLLIVAALTPVFGRAMEIQWTRMAGQWPVEASALVADFSHAGKAEILVLNRGGQLMLWAADGTAVGPATAAGVRQS